MRALRASRAFLVVGAVCALSVSCGGVPSDPAPGAAPSSTGPSVSAPSPSRTAASRSGQPPTVKPVTPSSGTPSSGTVSCAGLVSQLSLSEQVGQLLMVAVSSDGLTAADAKALRGTRTGSVILLGNTTTGVKAIQGVVRDVRKASVQPQGIETMLAADQEGGIVQRLQGKGFDRIPAAPEQATMTDAELRRRAKAWGKQLRTAGIDADPAPVADVVPDELTQVNEPIGRLRRGYGSSPKVVAAKVKAFTEGMDTAGVATATKHFPGLGRVRGNTDFAAKVIDSVTVRRDPGLAGFRAAVDGGIDMVMMSSAYYSKIDPDRRAAFSPKVIGTLLRGDLGFGGVVISDDLSAAAMKDLTPGERGVRFLNAGGDLAIVGQLSDATAMAKAIRAKAKADPAFADRVRQSAMRVLEIKARRGLTTC